MFVFSLHTLCLVFLGQMVVFFLIRCLSLCYFSYFSDAEAAQRFQNMSRVYLDSVPFDGHKCCLFSLSQEWEWTDCGTCSRFWPPIRLRLICPETASGPTKLSLVSIGGFGSYFLSLWAVVNKKSPSNQCFDTQIKI